MVTMVLCILRSSSRDGRPELLPMPAVASGLTSFSFLMIFGYSARPLIGTPQSIGLGYRKRRPVVNRKRPQQHFHSLAGARCERYQRRTAAGTPPAMKARRWLIRH